MATRRLCFVNLALLHLAAGAGSAIEHGQITTDTPAAQSSDVNGRLWGARARDWAESVVSALRPLLPAPPPGAPGPFALSHPNRLSAFVDEAGLSPREVIEGETWWHYPDEATAIRGLNFSGVAIRVAGIAGEDAVSAAHAAALGPFR